MMEVELLLLLLLLLFWLCHSIFVVRLTAWSVIFHRFGWWDDVLLTSGWPDIRSRGALAAAQIACRLADRET